MDVEVEKQGDVLEVEQKPSSCISVGRNAGVVGSSENGKCKIPSATASESLSAKGDAPGSDIGVSSASADTEVADIMQHLLTDNFGGETSEPVIVQPTKSKTEVDWTADPVNAAVELYEGLELYVWQTMNSYAAWLDEISYELELSTKSYVDADVSEDSSMDVSASVA